MSTMSLDQNMSQTAHQGLNGENATPFEALMLATHVLVVFLQKESSLIENGHGFVEECVAEKETLSQRYGQTLRTFEEKEGLSALSAHQKKQLKDVCSALKKEIEHNMNLLEKERARNHTHLTRFQKMIQGKNTQRAPSYTRRGGRGRIQSITPSALHKNV